MAKADLARNGRSRIFGANANLMMIDGDEYVKLTKSVADKIRSRTRLTGDGAALGDGTGLYYWLNPRRQDCTASAVLTFIRLESG
jgi:hypothetical protein